MHGHLKADLPEHLHVHRGAVVRVPAHPVICHEPWTLLTQGSTAWQLHCTTRAVLQFSLYLAVIWLISNSERINFYNLPRAIGEVDLLLMTAWPTVSQIRAFLGDFSP